MTKIYINSNDKIMTFDISIEEKSFSENLLLKRHQILEHIQAYAIKQLSIYFKQNYGYSVGQLWDLLQEIRVHYNEVLMKHWVQVFRNILDEDNFLPIQVIQMIKIFLIYDFL